MSLPILLTTHKDRGCHASVRRAPDVRWKMVGIGGFEPPTLSLEETCAIQLRHMPMWCALQDSNLPMPLYKNGAYTNRAKGAYFRWYIIDTLTSINDILVNGRQ